MVNFFYNVLNVGNDVNKMYLETTCYITQKHYPLRNSIYNQINYAKSVLAKILKT